MTATAHDAAGIAIAANVEFEWRVVEGPGVMHMIEGSSRSGKLPDCPDLNDDLSTADRAACSVTSTEEGQIVVEVQAQQDGLVATDRVAVKFRKDFGDSDADSAKGLPSYRLEAEHGRAWRSRYDVAKNEIVINSAHRDFIASKLTAAKHRRYVGKLYAKEVVLINFPHDPTADVLERLIELTLRTEDVL